MELQLALLPARGAPAGGRVGEERDGLGGDQEPAPKTAGICRTRPTEAAVQDHLGQVSMYQSYVSQNLPSN
jgi:hypothetical protein